MRINVTNRVAQRITYSRRTLGTACVVATLVFAGQSAAAPFSAALDIKNERFAVQVAAQNEDRRQGLSGRDPLKADEGMVFVWPNAAPRRFHMKDMKFPIDIIFLDDRGRVLNVAERAPVCGDADPCPQYYSTGPAQSVVEIQAGGAKRLQLQVGDTVTIPDNWTAVAKP